MLGAPLTIPFTIGQLSGFSGFLRSCFARLSLSIVWYNVQVCTCRIIIMSPCKRHLNQQIF